MTSLFVMLKYGIYKSHDCLLRDLFLALFFSTALKGNQCWVITFCLKSFKTCLISQEGPPLKSKGKASNATRVAVLTWRSLLVVSREWKYYWLHLILYMLLTLCMGTVFSGLGHSLSSVVVSLDMTIAFYLSTCFLIQFRSSFIHANNSRYSHNTYKLNFNTSLIADKSCSNFCICIILFPSKHCQGACTFERNQGNFVPVLLYSNILVCLDVLNMHAIKCNLLVWQVILNCLRCHFFLRRDA